MSPEIVAILNDMYINILNSNIIKNKVCVEIEQEKEIKTK